MAYWETALAALIVAAPASGPTGDITIVAHRGLAEGAPENTLSALRRSIARGVLTIELDIRVTNDGRLVVLHDSTLDRTTDCKGPVRAYGIAELKRCDAGSGERIPTLGEALRLVGDWPAVLLLDIKPGTPLAPVIAEIRANQAASKVILGLRRARDVTVARRELPQTKLLAFIRKPRDAADFVGAGATVIRLWSDWVDADPAQVGEIRALGAAVWVMAGRRLPRRDPEWRTLHDRMIAAGVQGLITDRPGLISVR